MPRARIIDFGCRLNQADGESIAQGLREIGFEIQPEGREGELALIVVNSCAVTAAAAAKSYASLRKLKKANPKALAVLCGCAASVEAAPPPEGLPFELLVPNARKNELPKLVAERFARLTTPTDAAAEKRWDARRKTRAYLKIQDGCENFCAFCVVPFARGPERSEKPGEILDNFKKLLDSGYKEIVLTGVNACAYDWNGKNLAWLLGELFKERGEFRLRLGSTEPQEVLEEVIKLMASERRLCRFLHMPLQHGSEKLLESMGRRCGAGRFAELAAMARELVPGIHLGADVIAGLPGETEELFEESRAFVERLAFANTHVFSYSKRAGTRAASMSGHCDAKTIERRADALKEIAAKSAENFAKSQVGLTLEVLTERPRETGFANGWSDNYLHLRFPVGKPSRNELLKVEALELGPDGRSLLGRIEG